MMPVATKAGGQNTTVGMAPTDVCKIPPNAIPTPFPNLGMLSTAVSTSTTVFVEKKEVVVLGSKTPSTRCDEPGTLGGIISGVNMNESHYKDGSSKVYAQGKKVIVLTKVTGQNGSNANTPGMQSVPSQQKVFAAL